MDAKALAKSKRAHSLHHSKKSHPSPKPKPATASAGSSKASSEKPAQPRQPRAAPALPSNWGRYEEEPDSDAEVPHSEVPGQSSDVPPPKSKGADYRHLLAEAKSQPQSHFDPYLDNFPSMHDVLPDFFSKAAGPLLSARGEAIVSRTKVDSFIVEDKATGSREAPFLSLNLDVLAEQLAKVDLAKRLFIEADLLPPELVSEILFHSWFMWQLTEASASGIEREPVQVQSVVGENEAAVELLVDSNRGDFTKEKTDEEENVWGSKSQKWTSAVDKVAVAMSRPHPHNQIITPESTKRFPADPVAEVMSKPSTFKAAAAEAELNALLDSLCDTKLTDTLDFCAGRSALKFEEKGSEASHKVPRKSWESSKAMPTPSSANINVLLDDLLEETSKLSKQNGLQAAESSAPEVSARSKVLDDFDSWLDTI